MRAPLHTGHMLNPNTQWDGIGGVALERGLGQERGALMNRIRALMKETPESSLPLSAV